MNAQTRLAQGSAERVGTVGGSGRSFYAIQRFYVRFMLWLVGRLLAAASVVDPAVRREVEALPEGFSFTMRVRNGVAGMGVRRDGDRLRAIGNWSAVEYPMIFEFKHTTHAFLVLGFVESTAVAFANDRIAVDGNTSVAMKLIRSLDRMQAVVLPKLIATRAIKSYPSIGFFEKLGLAIRIYGRLVLDLFGASR